MAKQIDDDMRLFTTVIRERNLKFDTYLEHDLIRKLVPTLRD